MVTLSNHFNRGECFFALEEEKIVQYGTHY